MSERERPAFLEHKALYYELIRENDSLVDESPDTIGAAPSARCVLCPRKCLLAPDGKTGACGARRNSGGEVYSLNYGRISSMALDPIEKKPIRRFKPGAKILSVGSYGCNLACAFCQNHSLLKRPDRDRPNRGEFRVTPEELAGIAVGARADGNIGLAYTYNEPLISYEFVYDTARIVADMGMDNVLVTNGYIEAAPFLALAPLIAALNVDLKGDDAFYRDLCGAADRSPVLRTIKLAREAGNHVEVTCLLVTGRNDNERAVADAARSVASISDDIPLHLTRFFPTYLMRDSPPTDVEFARGAAGVARGYLRHVFVGNI